MKHIMVITTSFPSPAFTDGQEAAGSFVYDFVHELAKYVKTTVIAPGNKDCIAQDGQVVIKHFYAPKQPLSLLKPTNPLNWLPILQTIASGQQAVMHVANSGKVDHIFALWALPSGYWAKKVSEKYNIPYSIWALGSDIWTLGKIPLVKNVLKDVLKHSRYCFADGYKLADDVTNISGKLCRFLPSSRKLPITHRKQLASAPPYKLAFLGRWHPNKGIDLLLESLNLLSEEDWQRISEVRIYGGGPLEKLVKTEVLKLKQKGRPVTIGGYLNREEATQLYLWTDYLLIPSRVESIPVVFSDAMQCLCPVIAMPVGDLPRLIKQYGVGIVATDLTTLQFTIALRHAINCQLLIFPNGLKIAKNDFNIVVIAQRLLMIIFWKNNFTHIEQHTG